MFPSSLLLPKAKMKTEELGKYIRALLCPLELSRFCQATLELNVAWLYAISIFVIPDVFIWVSVVWDQMASLLQALTWHHITVTQQRLMWPLSFLERRDICKKCALLWQASRNAQSVFVHCKALCVYLCLDCNLNYHRRRYNKSTSVNWRKGKPSTNCSTCAMVVYWICFFFPPSAAACLCHVESNVTINYHLPIHSESCIFFTIYGISLSKRGFFFFFPTVKNIHFLKWDSRIHLLFWTAVLLQVMPGIKSRCPPGVIIPCL